ncbi:MAG TPA: propanediol utilization protein [Firmicutes bacterium]|nr:propanediol utilization protein [Bacillota bacterium]
MEYTTAPFRVEISAHHCHVTQEVLDRLFGPGMDLDAHFKRPLSQPGQYVSDIRLDCEVKGRDGQIRRIEGLSILGPVRKYNQIEISLTEAFALRIDAPVRRSGDVAGSVPCTLIYVDPVRRTDVAKVELPCGIVAQKRHIHLDHQQAEQLGVKDGQLVSVAVASPVGRDIIFQDVLIREDPRFDLSMHLDTDEGNAVGARGTTTGRIVKL